VLICDGHYYANRNEEDAAYSQSEEQAIPRQVNRITHTVLAVEDTRQGDLPPHLLFDYEDPDSRH
jgi:hypothetical protein